jgi:hypothetical protein
MQVHDLARCGSIGNTTPRASAVIAHAPAATTAVRRDRCITQSPPVIAGGISSACASITRAQALRRTQQTCRHPPINPGTWRMRARDRRATAGTVSWFRAVTADWSSPSRRVGASTGQPVKSASSSASSDTTSAPTRRKPRSVSELSQCGNNLAVISRTDYRYRNAASCAPETHGQTCRHPRQWHVHHALITIVTWAPARQMVPVLAPDTGTDNNYVHDNSAGMIQSRFAGVISALA